MQGRGGVHGTAQKPQLRAHGGIELAVVNHLDQGRDTQRAQAKGQAQQAISAQHRP